MIQRKGVAMPEGALRKKRKRHGTAYRVTGLPLVGCAEPRLLRRLPWRSNRGSFLHERPPAGNKGPWERNGPAEAAFRADFMSDTPRDDEAFREGTDDTQATKLAPEVAERFDRLEKKIDRLRADWDPDRDPDRLMDKGDVAARLKCSPRKVDTLAAEGSLPKIKIGRLTRFSPDAVEAFIRRAARREGRR